jgi:hypothetical protein
LGRNRNYRLLGTESLEEFYVYPRQKSQGFSSECEESSYGQREAQAHAT